jgi:hypothetical protein
MDVGKFDHPIELKELFDAVSSLRSLQERVYLNHDATGHVLARK